MFPVIVNRDPSTTSMFMVGATLGESIIPVIIGVAIALLGSSSFPTSIILSSLALLGIYVLVNVLCKHHIKMSSEGGHLSSGGASSHPLQPLHTILGEDDDDDDNDDVEEDSSDRNQERVQYYLREGDDNGIEMVNSGKAVYPYQSDTTDRDTAHGNIDELSQDVHAYLNDNGEGMTSYSNSYPLTRTSVPPSTSILEQPISSPFHENNPYHPTIAEFAVPDEDTDFVIMQEEDDDVQL